MKNIFIINLLEHQDRWNLCQQELKKINLPYTRFEAIKYNNGLSRQDREMGCKLSHYELIKKAKNEDMEYITIFEDDIVIKDDFNEKIKLFDQYRDWVLFYLGGNTQYNRGNIPVDKNQFVVFAKYVKTTHAYCIHSSIYDELLIMIESNKDATIDAIYYGGVQRKYKCYAFYPAIVTQRTGISYIQGKVRDYSEWIK